MQLDPSRQLIGSQCSEAVVSAMKLHHISGRDVTNRPTLNNSCSRERGKWVGNAEKKVSVVVKLVGVDINESTVGVAVDQSLVDLLIAG